MKSDETTQHLAGSPIPYNYLLERLRKAEVLPLKLETEKMREEVDTLKTK